MSEFFRFHPITNFIYFGFVIFFAMFLMNPICLIISFVSALCYSFVLDGRKVLKFILYMIPLAIIAILINVLFNHEGTTILMYFDNGNPFTLESIMYGVASSIMILNVIMWFNLFNKIITTDKILYMFGKIVPSVSLLFSMIFRFVPRFEKDIKEISNAQKCIGKDINSGNIIQKIKNGLTILSAEITLAFENSIETAESMKARGYKNGKRTFFTIYKTTLRDKFFLFTILLAVIYVIIGVFNGAVYCRYFPSFRIQGIDAYNLSVMITYMFLCVMPIIVEIREVLRWKRLKSKI